MCRPRIIHLNPQQFRNILPVDLKLSGIDPIVVSISYFDGVTVQTTAPLIFWNGRTFNDFRSILAEKQSLKNNIILAHGVFVDGDYRIFGPGEKVLGVYMSGREKPGSKTAMIVNSVMVASSP